MNQGIIPSSRAGHGLPDRPWATETNLREAASAQHVVSPADLFTFAFNHQVFFPTSAVNSGGGAVTGNTTNYFMDSSSAANAGTLVYTSANGGAGGPVLTGRKNNAIGYDWDLRRLFAVRFSIESVASSAGYLRVYYGYWGTTFVQPTAASVGFEFRGTAPRLWVIAHNGSTLTQCDTGWDLGSTTRLTHDVIVESLCGLVNVYVDGVLRGATTGGPVVPGGHGGAQYQVHNGGNAARQCFWMGASRVTI